MLTPRCAPRARITPTSTTSPARALHRPALAPYRAAGGLLLVLLGAACLLLQAPVISAAQERAAGSMATSSAPPPQDHPEARGPDKPVSGKGGEQTATGAEGPPGAPAFEANRDMLYLPPQQEAMFERLDRNDDAAITRQRPWPMTRSRGSASASTPRETPKYSASCVPGRMPYKLVSP